MNFDNHGRPYRSHEPLGPYDSPPLGAHLVTPRWGFAHHGIYTGSGQVVHYGALLYDIVRRPVEEVPLEAFAQGRPVFLIQHDECCWHPEEVILRARSRLGENRYSLWTNNCEHFCEWCLHGEPRSFQVEDALQLPRRLGDWLHTMLWTARALVPGGASGELAPRWCRVRKRGVS